MDDNYNDIIDDVSVTPLWELGKGDDVNLSHPSYFDWPAAWPLPAMLHSSPIESEAIVAANRLITENDFYSSDWGHPGKQHKTLKEWND